MMKQVYVKPDHKVIELDNTTVMMADSVYTGVGGETDEMDTRGRRGKWGNLWYEEDVVHEEYY